MQIVRRAWAGLALRMAAIVMAIVILTMVYYDPYTVHATASDHRRLATWWQVLAGLVDLGLLGVAIVLVAFGRTMRGAVVVLVESLLNVVLSTVYVVRDGLARFIGGAQGREFISIYLSGIALRTLLVILLLFIAWRPTHAERDSTFGG